MNEFIDYAMSFYAHGEMYDIGATRDEVLIATGMRIGACKATRIPFEADKIDREYVQDIILEMRKEAV